MGKDEQETETKNRTSTNLASQLTNPLEMVKTTFQAVESLNFEVQARSQSQIAILSQDENDTETKNLTARNSGYELTNLLKMVKKTCQALESIHSDVRDKSQVEITMLDQDEHETDTKNRTSTNSVSELTTPLEMIRIQFKLLNRSILMSELGVRPKLRFWAYMSSKQTKKI